MTLGHVMCLLGLFAANWNQVLLTILLFHIVCTRSHLCASTSHPTDSTIWLSEINREIMVFPNDCQTPPPVLLCRCSHNSQQY
ncbi:hypothetical protein BO85DRAFT_104983 [Aspergillus piperis CBS 112811]|uniref:Uncharacterized protein n=1 Tax=Aspergillus piperis CBS 112811 TaxID=1448313 RepID=A0A8G1QVX2_9EURO|nr:hypothetical protein BO85DRAFT_104983 [Aspergillus piperis CBS 112811]RAH54542.1 hypothetical protein BO85DRAFT_104983 [Aspergillus piperis CBS 112811]